MYLLGSRIVSFEARNGEPLIARLRRNERYLYATPDAGVESTFYALVQTSRDDDRLLSWRDRRRQKGVDVRLTVDALTAAVDGRMDVAVIIAGDADFVPLVSAIRDRGPLVWVAAFHWSLAAELRDEADRVWPLWDRPDAWRPPVRQLPPLPSEV